MDKYYCDKCKGIDADVGAIMFLSFSGANIIHDDLPFPFPDKKDQQRFLRFIRTGVGLCAPCFLQFLKLPKETPSVEAVAVVNQYDEAMKKLTEE